MCQHNDAQLAGDVNVNSDAPPRRILLSQPQVTDAEIAAVTRALRSGWIAPLGPEVDAFEADIREFTGAQHALALASGTAALHLALLGIGVKPGDDVIVPTMTFAATAFAVTYAQANPIFIDIEHTAWCLDPELLQHVLTQRKMLHQRTGAIIVVDLFGQPADYSSLLEIAGRFQIPVLVDAAESLGAMHGTISAGTMGSAGVYSFNGNKIMTTSGGGMLVSSDGSLIDRARHRSTQSRLPLPWYQHDDIGYNYRLSNILAALGRAQLSRLPEMMERRRQIRDMYCRALADIPGVAVSSDPPWGVANSWLTTVTFDGGQHPNAPTRVREALARDDIEARPLWKPMHQQPVFRKNQAYTSGVADRLFQEGLCLPSGASLTDDEIHRVIAVIRSELA